MMRSGRTMRARKRDDIKPNREFSKAVLERDGYKCRMEQWRSGKWVEHGIKGSPENPLDPSHIYKRDDCGSAQFSAVVGIASCRDCHERYHGKLRDGVFVRVPRAREKAAYKAVCLAVTTFRVPRRFPPTRPGEAE